MNTVWTNSFTISKNVLDSTYQIIDEDSQEVLFTSLNTFRFSCIIALDYNTGFYKRSQCYQFLPYSLDTNYQINYYRLNINFFNKDSFIIEDTDVYTDTYDFIIGKSFKINIFSFKINSKGN